MNILVATNMYPNSYKPYSGIFIKKHVDLLKHNYGIESNVITGGGSNDNLVIILKKYLLFIGWILISIFTKKFDLIHAHFAFPTGFLALPAKWFRRKKMVLTIHGSDINSITKKKSVKYLCIKWTLMQADQIIAVSTDLKQKIENKFGIQPFKISVIDMGVDTTIFYTNRMLKSRPKDSYNFIFVGRLIPVKGLNILINAISLVVSNSELNLKCAVIGAGENESDYKSMVNEKSLQNHFEFLGLKSQSDIAEIMRNADAVIIPSLEEGFGLVAIEALACGTPVFASNTGGLKSLIKDGKNGYFFPPGDSNALCQLILKFWSGKISLDKTVYTNSNDPYDMNKKVAEIRKIYRGLIHG